MFRRIVSLLIPAIFVAAGMCFVSAPVARAFDADLANPDILDEATARAHEQSYWKKVPVKDRGKTFAYNDVGGITYAIRQLSLGTGNEAVINSAANINGCYLLTMNGEWFLNVSTSSNAEFYAAFPGHSKSDPKADPTPRATAAPAPTSRPAETAAPVTTPAPAPKATPKPTAESRAKESPKAGESPEATAKPKASQTPAPATTAAAGSDNTADTIPGAVPELSVTITAAPSTAPPAAASIHVLQNNEPETGTSINGRSVNGAPVVLSASTIAETEELVTIELRISDLPEGTASIQTPDGKTIQVIGTAPVEIRISKSDLDANGRVEILALDKAGTPSGVFMVQTGSRPSTPGLLWLWIAIAAGAAAAAISTAVIVNRKRAAKAE